MKPSSVITTVKSTGLLQHKSELMLEFDKTFFEKKVAEMTKKVSVQIF
jgi:hypothetical protein